MTSFLGWRIQLSTPTSNSSWATILRRRLLTWPSLCYRLYSKGRILGHKRAKRNSRPNTTLVQIEGVATKEDAQFYLGKVRQESKWIHYAILTLM